MLPSWGTFGGEMLASVARYATRRDFDGEEAPILNTVTEDSVDAVEVAIAIRDSPAIAVDGLAAKTLWEALALITIESQLNDLSASGMGVHQCTLLDALWYLWNQAKDEENQLKILSRAVAWLRKHHGRYGGRVDALSLTGTAARVSEDEQDPILRYRAALNSLAKDEKKFLKSIQTKVANGMENAHDLKHWCAILDIGEQLSGESRIRWLATLSLCRPSRTTSRWPRFEEAKSLAS